MQLLPPEALAGTAAAQSPQPMSVAEAHELAEANTYNTAQVEHPLTRTVTVTIRSSLNDLCLKKAKATWAPSSDAIRSILQQARPL
jgi:hypothetical protein